MSTRIYVILGVLGSLLAGCDGGEPAAEDLIAEQKWESTATTVDGLPVGERQVEIEMEDGASRAEALARLKTRKRIAAAMIQDPPAIADLLRRQSTVQTYLNMEIEPEEGFRDSLPADTIPTTRKSVVEAYSEPAGYRATVVTLTSETLERERLLDRAKQMRDRLGDDPSDDDVAALEEASDDEVRVAVRYAVPFKSVTAKEGRDGWIDVNMIGAAEVESLSDGQRVTSAYTIDANHAQFMVHVADIEAESPSPERVDEMIEEKVDEVGRNIVVSKLVDRLVEERPWSIYPEVVESDVEDE